MKTSCELLTEFADKARQELMAMNTYNSEPDKQYSENHPNATQAPGGSDDPFNNKGRGTGIYLDSTNGGTNIDINGKADAGISGRRALSGNLYTKDKPYECTI